jgi:hypothetical protein
MLLVIAPYERDKSVSIAFAAHTAKHDMTILSHVCLIIRGRQLTTIEHGAENQFAVDSFAKLRNMGFSPNIVQFHLTGVILFAISALPTEVNVTRWRWYTNQVPSRPPAASRATSTR